ncbi:MAG: gamma-glutamyltransferase family protein [Spirochaetaceae bacterium]
MIIRSNEWYRSRRSAVVSLGGMAATSQPTATQAAVSVLDRGGTAADAAVAAAAVLQVTQPCSTGLGGDAFCLYYDASSRTVHALNGSGRAPADLTVERLRREGLSSDLPPFHAHTVTVPGAAAAWQDVLERFGRLPRADVVAPAIRLATEGFPVAPMTALWWKAGAERQLSNTAFGSELMKDGRAPRAGERFRNPGLARVLESFAESGAAPFYTGDIAERVVAAVRQAGGCMQMSDLAAHRSEWVDPVSVRYRDVEVWECPPNGQGLAALIAMNILNHLDCDEPDSTRFTHCMVEAMRLAFADAEYCVADPAEVPIPLDELLSDGYGRLRAGQIDRNRAAAVVQAGDIARGLYPHRGGTPGGPRVGDDTVYLAVTDADGNGCSFINSNFMGFGTGIVPEGCGYSLQNRGYGFSLDPDHPNALRPGRRPYHTIIPGLITSPHGLELHSVIGVMGGMMQPQGHLQVVSALVDADLDPQSALDRERFQLEDGKPNGTVLVEESESGRLAADLAGYGHRIREISGLGRYQFGLGQIIRRTVDGWMAGSDGRGDGCALADSAVTEAGAEVTDAKI